MRDCVGRVRERGRAEKAARWPAKSRRSVRWRTDGAHQSADTEFVETSAKGGFNPRIPRTNGSSGDGGWRSTLEPEDTSRSGFGHLTHPTARFIVPSGLSRPSRRRGRPHSRISTQQSALRFFSEPINGQSANFANGGTLGKV